MHKSIGAAIRSNTRQAWSNKSGVNDLSSLTTALRNDSDDDGNEEEDVADDGEEAFKDNLSESKKSRGMV